MRLDRDERLLTRCERRNSEVAQGWRAVHEHDVPERWQAVHGSKESQRDPRLLRGVRDDDRGRRRNEDDAGRRCLEEKLREGNSAADRRRLLLRDTRSTPDDGDWWRRNVSSLLCAARSRVTDGHRRRRTNDGPRTSGSVALPSAVAVIVAHPAEWLLGRARAGGLPGLRVRFD